MTKTLALLMITLGLGLTQSAPPDGVGGLRGVAR